VKLLSVQGNSAHLTITIHEGRNRQIRRMCQAAGMNVTRLRRIAEGTVYLGDLKKGTWRYLTPEEIAHLKK
jgi:23S rRNA pseudouridine2605 synthase